ncbi:hypothetical protein T552_00029 [Pneumocystis carinii B80]|uniref:NADPH:adrenodoxin oxidoreductase, mitochondrial n=1 Tax=Pneumocystis carinii (strain B80) TaxID=1408658 RepID=A0A0W4ZSM8_PNEC8|nr:hypothetical protein T552_00029 [Pneumocystis carinii B80]KTW31384.1 hypothetical protein T552_00029 [Pneumocystis carinii B80]
MLFKSRKICQLLINRKLNTFRVCIIGSGPAGFYTADKLLGNVSGCFVDMYEAFPFPFGLLRLGVAPDNFEIKNVKNKFSKIAEYDGFRFIGNVRIGKDISLIELKRHYDCLVMAYGASEDRKLGLELENSLRGIYSAQSFVGWYNGDFRYQELNPDLESSDVAVIIGHGNVALDIARILLSEANILSKTDITERALETLRKSKIRHVKIIGRRGPLEMSFTIGEVRKLMELSNVSFCTPNLDSYISEYVLPENLTRSQKRLFDLLMEKNTLKPDITNKSWSLEFLLSPYQFKKDESKLNTLSSVLFEKNILKKCPNENILKAIGIGEMVNINTSCLIRSIGYKGIAIENCGDISIPFDNNRGIIPNICGRVLSNSNREIAYELPGIYTSGWIKTGPVGVIANTMHGAFETANSIIQDWKNKKPFLNSTSNEPRHGFNALLPYFKEKGIRFIQWKDWKKLEDLEYKKGKELGKFREKFVSINEILKILE